MGAYLLEWLSLFFRWFHVIAGVAWIGASFYFVWLDLSLRKPPQWKADKGISGDLWAVHGGGFYEIAKYKLEPEGMPKTLHWFKWEAYTTWLTGAAMMSLPCAAIHGAANAARVETPTSGTPRASARPHGARWPAWWRTR